MPNLKASLKDLRKTKKRTTFNSRLRDRIKRAFKSFNKLVETGDFKKAKVSLAQLNKIVDKAAKNNVMKKTTASRKISRLAKKLNTKSAASDVKTTKKSA